MKSVEIQNIKNSIMENDIYMYQALMTIYKYQTEDEQECYSTYQQNGIGFNAVDADILTSFAKFFEVKGYLTDKQKEIAKKKLLKYAGQIAGLEMESVKVKEQPKKEVVVIKIKIEIRDADKCNGKYSAFVSSDYDRALIDLLRSFSNRWYHAETKEWEINVRNIDDVIEFANGSPRYSIQIINNVNEPEKKETIDIPEEYKFKTEPFEHQVEAISFGLNHDKWLLGDSMGLGKTKTAIDIACIKKQVDGYHHCLIICGVNGLKYNWVNEIKIHSNESSHLLGQVSSNKIGSIEDRYNDIVNLSNIEEYFIITNIETLRNEKCSAELKKQCGNGQIEMIILDEAHTCKNPSSQQGKGMLKLSAKTMIAMTGTPLMNSPIDLYFILKWLGYEKHSFYQFKNHYCIMGGYGDYQVVGYKNLSEIKDQLKEMMLRRLKEDVFDLPEKVYVDEFVELTPKQKLIYNETRQEIAMNIDLIANNPNPLAELIRMRQATGYTGILSSTIQESAKLDRLEELVDEAVSNGEKVVIFSNWTQMTNPILSRLNNKYYCVSITGELSAEEREIAKEEFQTNKECKVIVGTTGAMGTGITLTAGTVEIFVDEPWNKALKEQAVDRCHRIGTTKSITIYTLMAKDTIDERIHDLVEQKGEMSNALIDGKVNSDRKQLLEYLIS